jgi:hypothetical protein
VLSGQINFQGTDTASGRSDPSGIPARVAFAFQAALAGA